MGLQNVNVGVFEIQVYAFTYMNFFQENVLTFQNRAHYTRCTVNLTKLVYFGDVLNVDTKPTHLNFVTNLVYCHEIM